MQWNHSMGIEKLWFWSYQSVINVFQCDLNFIVIVDLIKVVVVSWILIWTWEDHCKKQRKSSISCNKNDTAPWLITKHLFIVAVESHRFTSKFSYWWEPRDNNGAPNPVYSILPYQTSKLRHWLHRYCSEGNLVRQFLIFSGEVEALWLDMNRSAFEWWNHGMVIGNRRANIGDSSVKGQNSGGCFLWEHSWDSWVVQVPRTGKRVFTRPVWMLGKNFKLQWS